jgi:uncharacterized protein with beta-barrel porin domain
VFGVEQRIGGLLIGVTGAAGRTTASFGNSSGHVTTDSWHAGLYSVMDLSGVYLEMGGLFGSTDSVVRRNVTGLTLTAPQQSHLTLSGNEWVANLGVAAPVKATESLVITPSLRGIVQGQNLGSGQENSMNGLEVSTGKQSTTTVQHQAGVELRQKLAIAGKPAAASLSVDWLHNYNAKGRGMNMALGSDPNANFSYKGSDAGADAFHVGAALETVLSRRVSLRLSGDYQTQSKFSTARGMLTVGYQF